jgi:anti-sigma B factor antagonist
MSPDELITISVEHQDGVVVLVVGGEIDVATAPVLDTAIVDVLAQEPSALVIDLAAVEFLGSAGLRLLVQTKDKLNGSGPLAVVATGLVSRPIQLIGLDNVISLHKTRDDALTAVGKNTEHHGYAIQAPVKSKPQTMIDQAVPPANC